MSPVARTSGPQPVKGWWDWSASDRPAMDLRLMYHGEEEIAVQVVSADDEGLFFKRADNLDELLFVPWPRIKQVRGPAFWTRVPPPPKPASPVKKKPAPKKAPQAELLAAEGGAH